MTMTSRRQAGEGSISRYDTSKGARYSIRYYVPQEYGDSRRVQVRGFITKKDAAKELRKVSGKIDCHAYTAPAKLTEVFSLGAGVTDVTGGVGVS